MASNSEYEQRRGFEDKKLKRIDGGVDGRKTWKIAGGFTSNDMKLFRKHLFNEIETPNIEEKLKTK